jgi:hypothetical protein
VNARRDGERGLSLMEAIVIATITALLALLVMPLLPRAATRNAGIAERGVDVLDALRAEREFRTLVRAVSLREVDGEPQAVLEGVTETLTIRPSLEVVSACARAGSPTVRLAVERNALVCLSDGRRRVMLRWAQQGAAFSYSRDGVAWFQTWSDPAVAPYVRFEVRRGERVTSSWIERAMGEPS